MKYNFSVYIKCLEFAKLKHRAAGCVWTGAVDTLPTRQREKGFGNDN